MVQCTYLSRSFGTFRLQGIWLVIAAVIKYLTKQLKEGKLTALSQAWFRSRKLLVDMRAQDAVNSARVHVSQLSPFDAVKDMSPRISAAHTDGATSHLS